MSTVEELKILLASYERLAIYTRDEERRRKLREIINSIKSLLADQEQLSRSA